MQIVFIYRAIDKNNLDLLYCAFYICGQQLNNNTIKQVFKHQQYTLTGCINRIKHYYSLATNTEVNEGFKWYADAQQFARELSEKYNTPFIQVCGIIAALSPQITWEQNKVLAVTFLRTNNVKNTAKVRVYKCRAIKETINESDILEILSPNGNFLKTRKFFINIYDFNRVEAVTIDRHAIGVATQAHNKTDSIQENDRRMTVKQYQFFETAYIRAAQILGLTPNQLQAVTWVTYRRLRELPEHKTVEIF